MNAVQSTAGILRGALAPRVGLHRVVCPGHLRSGSARQVLRFAEFNRRLDAPGGVARRLRDEVGAVRRDAAAKKEWWCSSGSTPRAFSSFVGRIGKKE